MFVLLCIFLVRLEQVARIWNSCVTWRLNVLFVFLRMRICLPFLNSCGFIDARETLTLSYRWLLRSSPPHHPPLVHTTPCCPSTVTSRGWPGKERLDTVELTNVYDHDWIVYCVLLSGWQRLVNGKQYCQPTCNAPGFCQILLHTRRRRMQGARTRLYWASDTAAVPCASGCSRNW